MLKTVWVVASWKASDGHFKKPAMANYVNNNDLVPRLPGELDFVEIFLGQITAKVAMG